MKQRIEFALLDPTGNITVLVPTSVPPAAQPAAAARLMEAEPTAEQVGFLSPDPECALALRMAGGEFCGNAAMSAAALWVMDAGIDAAQLTVRVSGAEAPVPAAVRALPGGGYEGRVSMPRPRAVETAELPGGGRLPLVRFDGIAHLILTGAPDRAAASAAAPAWCEALGADALGLLYLDRTANTLTPLVYVPAAGTLCWESSCASGATAAAAYLAREAERFPFELALRQPGGVLRTAVASDGAITLAGTVRLVKRGVLELELP